MVKAYGCSRCAKRSWRLLQGSVRLRPTCRFILLCSWLRNMLEAVNTMLCGKLITTLAVFLHYRGLFCKGSHLLKKKRLFGSIFYFLISCSFCDAIGPVRRSGSIRKGNACGECKQFLLFSIACLKIWIIPSLCRVLQSCCSSQCIKCN